MPTPAINWTFIALMALLMSMVAGGAPSCTRLEASLRASLPLPQTLTPFIKPQMHTEAKPYNPTTQA